MEFSINAIEKKVAVFTAEFRWVRASVIVLVAVAILMFGLLVDMKSSISALQVDVGHKFEIIEGRLTDLETEFSDFKAGQQQIFDILKDAKLLPGD